MAAALSQQKVPGGRWGYRPSGTNTNVWHRSSSQQICWHSAAVGDDEFIFTDA